MIKINLLAEAKAAGPKKKAAPALAGGQVNNLTLFGVIALALVVSLFWWWTLASKKKSREDEVRRAQQEVDRLKSIIEEVQAYERKKASLEAKIKLINDLKTNQRGPVHLMDEVSKALPDLVWLMNMDVSGSTIALKGQALTPNAIANFLESLKKSPYFQEPKFNDMTQAAAGIYNFDLAFQFTYAPAAVEAGAPPPKPAAAGPGT